MYIIIIIFLKKSTFPQNYDQISWTFNQGWV